MPIDYLFEAERYRPRRIKTLLVAECPPPKGKAYFYVPRQLPQDVDIDDDQTLPATIFYHYFDRLPKDTREYTAFLKRLQKKGVFLIDIYDVPTTVRGSKEGFERIRAEIPKLRRKLKKRGIDIPEANIILLPARHDYRPQLRAEFPEAQLFRLWKDFRLRKMPCRCCKRAKA